MLDFWGVCLFEKSSRDWGCQQIFKQRQVENWIPFLLGRALLVEWAMMYFGWRWKIRFTFHHSCGWSWGAFRCFFGQGRSAKNCQLCDLLMEHHQQIQWDSSEFPWYKRCLEDIIINQVQINVTWHEVGRWFSYSLQFMGVLSFMARHGRSTSLSRRNWPPLHGGVPLCRLIIVSSWFAETISFSPSYTLSPIIMVQWKMANNLKGNYYWRNTFLTSMIMGGSVSSRQAVETWWWKYMKIVFSPYVLSLVEWTYGNPLNVLNQLLPVASAKKACDITHCWWAPSGDDLGFRNLDASTKL